MTPEEYQKAVLVTESNDFNAIRIRMESNQMLRLLHAVIGMQTEIGELADAIKKRVFYGKALDSVNILEEAGDLEWYFALFYDAMQKLFPGSSREGYYSREENWKRNISKLKVRYGAKFSEEAANTRDLKKEMDVLATGPTYEEAFGGADHEIGILTDENATRISQKTFPSGAKSSKENPRYDLIPMEADLCLADRLQKGIDSGYAKDNWRKGLSDPDFLRDRQNHMEQHFKDFKAGNFTEDDEWGHIGAIMWWCMLQAVRIKANAAASIGK